MKFPNIRFSLMALGAAAALVSTSAHAVWTFDTTGKSTSATNTGTYSYIGDAGDPTASLSGVYAANTSGVVGGNWSTITPTSFGNNGLGIQSDGTGTPNHAIDNVSNTEGVLLSFGGQSVILSSIGLGYTSNGVCSNGTTLANNASCPTGSTLIQEGPGTASPAIKVDLSVFRWTGMSAPPTLQGVGVTTMTGWELVGNYGDMTVDTSNPYNTVNATGKASSWWLITAYNNGFTQAGNSTTSTATLNVGSADNGGDYFKLLAVAGTKCTSGVNTKGVCGGSNAGVPEPASLALTSVALLGVVGLRRRKAKMAA